MFRVFLTSLVFGLFPLMAADLKVAVLHPLLGDLARKIGGAQVEVIDLIGKTGDPHHFEPKPAELKRAEGASVYLVAGMGLETYLPELKSIIPKNAVLCEVGTTLPALEGNCEHDDHEEHNHAHEKDPHWWHSIDLFRRAITVVTGVMADASPDHSEEFRKNAESYRHELDDLERWTKREISKIPRDNRHLATAHAAFNYFCRDFGFTAHPLQGLNREQMPDPAELATLIQTLRDEHVAAIFPEKESNPKILKILTEDTGIRLADPLTADGTGVHSYAEMYRHNVSAIVNALGSPPPAPSEKKQTRPGHEDGPERVGENMR